MSNPTLNESSLIRHEACPECPSSDALAVYDDGHAHCFSCGAHIPKYEEGGSAKPSLTRDASFLEVEYRAIPKRHIEQGVCRSNGYGFARWHGKTVQVAEYLDPMGSRVVAQKIKTEDKQFVIIGDGKALALWPMWRFKPGGKRVLICEGETDLLAWQTLQGDKWPAVSVPSGAGGAAKAIAKALEWVESFDEVVLCFDSDEAGQKGLQSVCEILSPGKARIMRVPNGCKDICEAVQAGRSKELIEAYWSAVPFRPDGVVGDNELIAALLAPPPMGHAYPWQGLNDMLMGMRSGELVTLTAGTGVGKSLTAGLIAVNLIRQGLRVGYISLEESLTRTAERLVSVAMKKPLHRDREGVTDADLVKAWKDNFSGRVCVFNHFGSLDAERLMARVRYMRVAEKVDFVVLDHLSILVSGWDSADGDERRLIDNCMTTLRSICEQTGVGMLLISHLRAPDAKSKSHEEGGRPKLSELRGSKAISQLSDSVLAIVRDQMGDNKHISEVWVLKNRFTGVTGHACTLAYDPNTGLMEETDAAFAGSDQSDF